MFAPDVEARFKRIEDAQVVAAELLHRFEKETRDRFAQVETFHDDVRQWMEHANTAIHALIQGQVNLQDTVAELSRTVDRFLRARLDGGSS